MGEKKSQKNARLLLQRLYISLGDLFRYRCSCSNQPLDAEHAQRHYETAQRLAPKNSHPFNQMAVLSLMTKRRFDAVYYFCRALAAANPILSVSENLMAIFNDACIRSDADLTFDREFERNRRQTISKDSHRSEIWVSADGKRSAMSSSGVAELDEGHYGSVVQRLPIAQLTQRLFDSILNVHGRMFSKVGLDALPDAVCRCLWELEASLSLEIPLLSFQRLSQLALLNFFSVWRSSPSSQSSSGAKSTGEIFAIEFTIGCAALIIRHARILFVSQKFDALRRLMPCVKLYADWLMYNHKVWNPPPCALDPTVCPVDLDLFEQIAGFASITAFCDVSSASLTNFRNGNEQPLVPVRLEEDDLVTGFAPFAKIPLAQYETQPGTDPHTASFAARLQRFRDLSDFLCGIPVPVLEYNTQTKEYTSLATSICRSEQTTTAQTRPENLHLGNLPPPLFDYPSQDQSTGISSEPAEITALRQRRRDLLAQGERHKAENEYRRDMLKREEVAAGSIVIEVRPLILIFDTNSIIDYLPAVKGIIESCQFTVVLPLVVISELESLSSGPRTPSAPFGVLQVEDRKHDEFVCNAARDALSFFELQFTRRNNRLKAMTSHGNFVDNIAFRDQTSVAMSNDDAILGCALHYCNEQLDRKAAMHATEGGSGTTIKREVVLITCDRNLRIKAHLRRVPTCPMRPFLKWASVPPMTSGPK